MTPATVVGRVAFAPQGPPDAPGEALVAEWDAGRRVVVLRPQGRPGAAGGLTVSAAALPGLLADLAVCHGQALAATRAPLTARPAGGKVDPWPRPGRTG